MCWVASRTTNFHWFFIFYLLWQKFCTMSWSKILGFIVQKRAFTCKINKNYFKHDATCICTCLYGHSSWVFLFILEKMAYFICTPTPILEFFVMLNVGFIYIYMQETNSKFINWTNFYSRFLYILIVIIAEYVTDKCDPVSKIIWLFTGIIQSEQKATVKTMLHIASTKNHKRPFSWPQKYFEKLLLLHKIWNNTGIFIQMRVYLSIKSLFFDIVS